MHKNSNLSRAVLLTLALILPSALMAAPVQWEHLLALLQSGQSEAVQRMSSQDRVILQARVLINMHQPEQALKILENQTGSALVSMLKIEADRQLRIAAVHRAGGNSREVRMKVPAELEPALSEVDARLHTLIELHKREQAAAAAPSLPAATPIAVPTVAAVPALPLPDAAGQAKKNRTKPTHIRKAAGRENLVPVTTVARNAVLIALQAWCTAWSKRDADAYFAAYADTFDGGARFKNIDAWKSYKRRVIGKRAFINVRAENIEVIGLSEERLRVEFLQHFRSDAFNSDDLKALVFEHSDAGWKITHEGPLP
ncbi:MAG: hypothetical protein COW18_12195 [Zetaproteobacteria bacterium CG12_big_fil_rev_8_21_14_0_65_54_13]|nr:MAG: hypothetical protein COW18_12195 [Zetaproteobacteria bacterium CG12_big_fil_rev_8_21_14_0_65_54_13]PIX55754.1 MAG: hypothetical protein COZ50_01120 [Zetaproteobacteria bacterium CG_4_10_14_3_um_filter_54_28]PJA30898.1 MAG: hypothetical protein CO188_01390 [Zetaproteobacteria bacterium CG_4_9_14_3_um_filter_54_145]